MLENRAFMHEQKSTGIVIRKSAAEAAVPPRSFTSSNSSTTSLTDKEGIVGLEVN
jgi:hypothetical protein